MSTMLEQAIVDATALREVALKNAEQAVLEKYSNQIKEAVEGLLEQEEIEMQVGDTPEASIVDEVPLAATDGESLCPCPDEDEEIEINFSELSRQMEDEGEVDLDNLETHEDAAEEVVEEPLQEDLDLEEIDLEALVEKLTVDIIPQKNGWAGSPSREEYEFAEEELLALEQDTEVKEELAAMRKAVKKLEESNTKLKSANSHLTNKNTKIEKLFHALKDKLHESTLMNARLFYTNKALADASLNERQKSKIVESISKAKTVEESKVIFETLQSTVGTPQHKRAPKSLSEAINKTSSTLLLSSGKKEESKSNPEMTRWKALAGLK